MWLFLSVNAGFSLRNEVFEEKMRRIWGKRDAFGENKNCMCFDAAHVQHSFCTRSAPQFYERTTSAERVMNVATTSEELGEHKEKRWCETGRDEELKREGEVYMWEEQEMSLDKTEDEIGQNKRRVWTKQETSLGETRNESGQNRRRVWNQVFWTKTFAPCLFFQSATVGSWRVLSHHHPVVNKCSRSGLKAQ